MQVLTLSSCGKFLCIVSIFGNKIHIYNTQNETLKFCIYLGPTIQVIEKVLFSEKKSKYFFILKNENKFNIYKLPIDDSNIKGCVCNKYDDSNISTEKKKEGFGGFFGYFKKFSKNKDIWESHASGELPGEIDFIDFDRNHQNYLDEEYENSRYQDIRTYTYNKVKLPSNNYINASYIDLPSKKFFIATQGPLPHTIDHFWEMVWENDVKYIFKQWAITMIK